MKYPRYAKYRDSGVDWLGKVPAHWGVKRLRFLAATNPLGSKHAGVAMDDLVSFVPMDAVGEYGGLRLDVERELSEVDSGYTYFADGDVLLAKITPCFENGKGALAKGLTNGIAFGTTELHVLRAGPRLDRRFLFYLSIAHPFRKIGESRMYGAGGQKRVPEDFIKDFRTPLPPLEEQRAIAAFLDRETARIDALIATKRRFLALLAEKREALISRAVTRGLDADVPLKDSEIAWLGSIPDAWKLTRLGILCDVGNGSTPSREEPLYWDGGNHAWLNSSTVNRGVVVYADQFVTDLAIKECHLPPVRPLSVLVALTGEGKTRGRVALLTFDATISQHLAYVTPRDDRIDPEFLRWWLHAHRGALRMLSDGEGGTKGAITCELLKSFPVPLLLPDKQRAIVRILDSNDAKLHKTTRAVDSAIAALAELRSSLVASAVTGRMNVRAAA